MYFSFSFAGNSESPSDSILQPKPSPTTLYIVEGTQTNILETAELKDVKVVKQKKKKTFKKTISKKQKKQTHTTQAQENGERKEETENTPFLNQSSKTALLLSVSFQQSVVVPTSYSPVKMINYKEALTLCLVPECNLVASTCYQISFQENQFRNAFFTRPPPIFI